MASHAKRSRDPEPVRPIIVRKIIEANHGGHHGGAWKVAYADFVTAMMAFFLLMWILGATTEKQRKGIADYFAPTLVELRSKSAGANGPFGGDSLTAKEKYAHGAHQSGTKSITIPKGATGGTKEGDGIKAKDQARFARLKRQLDDRMKRDPKLARLRRNVRFTDTREGLRIDLVDESDFAMFALGTQALLPAAQALMQQVATVIAATPNDVIVRGHTDALPYTAGRTVNNWTLSSARAEATRKALADSGVGPARFARIEGVAEREPYVPGNLYDPRNRRMSITLAWSRGAAPVDEPIHMADATPAPAAH
ncbi:flagellar motor protein MotB [Sphingomonas montana]|uniref:flagellar motor protein MotB n=1 Tax=Sphingomonas montana TaxID=1843236 RepID=UPI00096EB7B4|nr:flagellar motor protein MotB [Sphingomonas montana]